MYAIDQLLDDPDLAIKAFTALKEERAKRKELKSKVKADAPKVAFANAVESTPTAVTVEKFAKATYTKLQ